MQRYIYTGPVLEFGRCIANNWQSTTVAATERKARSNLSYQFKRQFNKTANTRIELPGKLEPV